MGGEPSLTFGTGRNSTDPCQISLLSFQFWLTCPIGMLVAGLGAWVLPNPKINHNGPKPALDFLGTALGTGGLILLTFVLSSGGVYGWGKVIRCRSYD